MCILVWGYMHELICIVTYTPLKFFIVIDDRLKFFIVIDENIVVVDYIYCMC
jgi:hypothetical protein